MMSQKTTGNGQPTQPHRLPPNLDDSSVEEIEEILIQGVSLQSQPIPQTSLPVFEEADDAENANVPQGGDIQGALGLFAEAAQDMATAGVELGLGRHFACADFCNQAAEKAAQAISLLRFGRKSMYDHDLRALGTLVGAPPEILDIMEILTPFHPESFYAETPPEEADEVINADQASSYVSSARRVVRWARNLVLSA